MDLEETDVNDLRPVVDEMRVLIGRSVVASNEVVALAERPVMSRMLKPAPVRSG